MATQRMPTSETRPAIHAAAARLRALAELSRELGRTSPGTTPGLGAIARAVADCLGDACVVSRLTDDMAALTVIAAHHRDPLARSLVQEIVGTRTPLEAAVLRSALYRGRAVRIARVDERVLIAHARVSAIAAYVERRGVASIVATPIFAAGRAAGTIVALRDRGEAPYRDEDEWFLEDAAASASLLLDNERLAEDARRERIHREEATLAKNEFLVALSHELRTPLNAILGWARLLRRRSALDDARFSHALDVIERNAKAEATLVDGLLEAAGTSSGRVRLALADVDLAQVAYEVVHTLAHAAAAARVTVNVVERDHPIVRADAARLRVVVHNFLLNAIKFTPPGGHVEVSVNATTDRAELRVKDDGEGIDPAFVPHVFDGLRRTDGEMTRAHAGLGLGLAVARRLVELHGGRVRVRSEGKGRGATFGFVLPRVISVRTATNALDQDARK